MTVTNSTDSHVDAALVEKAVSALLKHHNANLDEKQSLLGSDVPLQVQFGLEVAPGRSQPKPVRLLIPNPVHSIEDAEVCLIVKEDSKESIQELIQAFPEHMSCIKKVLGLQSLRNKHAEYQQRRLLLAKYDVFMADDRILPMLTKALGKDFLKAKKQPIAVRITRREALPFAIKNALSATYMTIPEGTCVTVKAGNTAMKAQELVENVVRCAEAAVPKIPRKWANIRSISIKLPNSTALPVYNKTPEQLLEIAEMAGLSSAWKTAGHKEAAATNKKQKQQVEEETVAKEERKRKTKSPLLKALKKQKQQESRNDDVEKEQQEASNKSDEKKLKTRKQKTAKPEESTLVNKMTKKRKQSEDLAKESGEPEITSKKDKKTKKAKDGDESPGKTLKKDDSKKKKKTNDAFITSKKFKGSKKGYVFKNGQQGVGYYIDAPPVVDKMAMDAIARMQSRPKAGGRKGRRSRGGR